MYYSIQLLRFIERLINDAQISINIPMNVGKPLANNPQIYVSRQFKNSNHQNTWVVCYCVTNYYTFLHEPYSIGCHQNPPGRPDPLCCARLGNYDLEELGDWEGYGIYIYTYIYTYIYIYIYIYMYIYI